MQFNPMSLDITPSGILRTSTLPTCDGWREKRESEKGPKPWKTGSVAKCQGHKKNPASHSENGVDQKQRETLCRGFMVELGGFEPPANPATAPFFVGRWEFRVNGSRLTAWFETLILSNCAQGNSG